MGHNCKLDEFGPGLSFVVCVCESDGRIDVFLLQTTVHGSGIESLLQWVGGGWEGE